MKVFKPVVLAFVALIVSSLAFGLLFDAFKVTISYSAAFYLLLCFAQMVHSLEEYATRFWMQLTVTPLSAFRRRRQGREPMMDRAFFVLFNIILNAVMLVFYWPILLGVSWSWLFGVGMTLVGVGNGILHCGTALRHLKYFSGCISGVLTFITGVLTLSSLSVKL
nr:HXXEE domain-containing protein [Candidatus Njordarchaeota archaeon]